MSSALTVMPTPHEIEQQAATTAPRIKAAFPKDLSDAQALEVARVAAAYGLDPFLGELMPYQGKPYITFNGRVRLADRHPAYAGIELEPATAAEIEALKIEPDQVVFRATVYRTDRRPLVAYGRAGGKAELNPVARQWAAEVAYKRATERALRAAFPVPIPGLEESLTPEQLRAIHAYDADAGVSVAERHATLEELYGVSSSKHLTKAQASAYLDRRQTPADDERSFHIVTGDAGPDVADDRDWPALGQAAEGPHGEQFAELYARVAACAERGTPDDWDALALDVEEASEWMTAEQRGMLRPVYQATRAVMRERYPTSQRPE